MDIFALLQTFGSNAWIYGGSFILILSLLVFVHEWGHYIVARMCGVRVETFSVGFGREIFGRTDSHGTRWKVSLIPLGGYVKMFGDSDPASAGKDEKVKKLSKKDREVAFFSKSVAKRSGIVFAGPAINYIFAIILLAGLYMFHGQPVTPPQASAVIEGSAAAKAGFEPHDMVVAIDGKKINSFEDIRREMMIALDTEKVFSVQRGDEDLEISATPEKVTSEDRFGFSHSRGLLGLISPQHAVPLQFIVKVDGRDYSKLDALAADATDAQKEVYTAKQEARVEKIRKRLVGKLDRTFAIEIDRGAKIDTLFISPLKDQNADLIAGAQDGKPVILMLAAAESKSFVRRGVFDAIGSAVHESYVITVGTFEALGQMITGTRSAKELGGIIRIGAIAGDMAQQGLIALILFTALLSINLGLINLFPIPLLDGGHLVFYAIEAIQGKPVPDQYQEYAFRTGFALLIALMAFANINDLLQLFL